MLDKVNNQENHPLHFFIDLIEQNQFFKLHVDFKYDKHKASNVFYDDKLDSFILYEINEETGHTEVFTFPFKIQFLKQFHYASDDLFLLFDSKVLTFKSIEEQFLYFDNIIGRLNQILEQAQQPRFSKYEYVHSKLLDLSSKITQKYCRHNPINQPYAPKQIDGNKLGMDIVFSNTMKNLKTPELQLKYITDTITEIENRILKNSASPNITDDQWFQIEHEYLSFYQQKLINYNMHHNINNSSEPPLNLKFNGSIMSRYPATTSFFTNPAIKLDLSNTHKYDIAFPNKKCDGTNPQNPFIEGTSICQRCYSKVLVKLLDELPLNDSVAFIEYQLSQQSNKQLWLKELSALIVANESHLNRKNTSTSNNYLTVIDGLHIETKTTSFVSLINSANPLTLSQDNNIPSPNAVVTLDTIVSASNLVFIMTLLESIGITSDGKYALSFKKKGAIRGVVLALIDSGHLPNKGIHNCCQLIGTKIGVEIQSKLEDTNVSDDYKAKAEEYINSQSS